MKELVSTFHLILYSRKWVEQLLRGISNKVIQIYKKKWGDYPLCRVITQLTQRCCIVNIDFQKLETISFDLVEHRTADRAAGDRLPLGAASTYSKALQ